MGGGHNRRKLAGDGAKRPPPKGGQFSTVWYLWVPNGAELTSPRGGSLRAIPAGFRRLWPPLTIVDW